MKINGIETNGKLSDTEFAHLKHHLMIAKKNLEEEIARCNALIGICDDKEEFDNLDIVYCNQILRETHPDDSLYCDAKCGINKTIAKEVDGMYRKFGIDTFETFYNY